MMGRSIKSKKLKKPFLALSGLILVFSIISLAACGNSPTVPASHYTNGVLKDSFNNCLDCHQRGANGAPREPANHSSYTNDRCLKCHKPAP
jgi:hypothetical protein